MTQQSLHLVISASVFLLMRIQCLVAAQALGRCSNCRYGSDYCAVDNRCLFGCQPGFHGNNCSLPCTIKNCLECYMLQTTQEQCSMCSGNVYGPLCNLHCNSNCKGLSSTSRSSCDTQGNCIYGCELGYHGNKCDQVDCRYEHCAVCNVDWRGNVYCERCAHRYYWHSNHGCVLCSEYCATPYDCNPLNGNCNNGCKVGRFGDKCHGLCDIVNCDRCYSVSGSSSLCSQCSDGFYPDFYQKTCLPCRSECVGCSSATGDCTKCAEGKLGDRCQFSCDITGCKTCEFDQDDTLYCAECKDGFYKVRESGRFSRYICQTCSPNCENGLCDKLYGHCFNCTKGYYGKNSGTGDIQSCQFKCSENCVTEYCDQYDGSCECKPGWYGKGCIRNCPTGCATCVGYVNGKCPSCEPGYYGNHCDQRCPSTCEKRQDRPSTSPAACHIDSGQCQYGCLSGYYGVYCNETCSINCDGASCNQVTGACQAGCTAYWYGLKCDKKCSSNCISERISSINRPCDMIWGKCLQGCKDNYFGDQCDLKCNYKCREQKCFQDTGLCRYGCMTGFTGVNCSRQCDQNCPEECPHCVDRYCDVKTRDCLHGCVKGFYGPKCQNNCSSDCLNRDCDETTGRCKQCRAGFYGQSCTLECGSTCSGGICDRNGGYCSQCKAGYHGTFCDVKCPQTCLNQICKYATGECEDGCIAGYFREKCDTECWDGWYGENCGTPCGHCQDGTPCRKTDGHCISGCDVGYGGDTCSHNLKQSGALVYDSQKVAVIAGASVSAILFVCIVVTIAILCYCRKQRAKKSKTEEPAVVYTANQNSNTLQVYQAGSSIAQTESDVSIHQVESHLLGTVEPEIIFSGLVAHRDYYILHRGTVLKHVDREDAYVKVLLLNDTVEKQTHLSWLKKEVEILQLCTPHPNIISFLTSEEKSDRFYVALSSCMQNNLVPYLHEINLSDPEEIARDYDHQLIQFVIDVSDAMCHLRRHKIIHRYIRARSIYLSDNLVAKVGDFDFAMLEEDYSVAKEHRRRDLPSSYSCWLSPEALISNTYSSSSDIWSYGILLWEIFTLGQHPYDRLEGSKLERAIVDGQRPPKPALASMSMYRLMKSCWRYSPEDRPTAESALCQLTETQV